MPVPMLVRLGELPEAPSPLSSLPPPLPSSRQAWASAYRDFFQQIRRQVALKPSVPSKTAGFVSGLSATGINTAGLTAKALSGLAGL